MINALCEIESDSSFVGTPGLAELTRGRLISPITGVIVPQLIKLTIIKLITHSYPQVERMEKLSGLEASLLGSFRKSNPPQNRQLNISIKISTK